MVLPADEDAAARKTRHWRGRQEYGVDQPPSASGPAPTETAAAAAAAVMTHVDELVVVVEEEQEQEQPGASTTRVDREISAAGGMAAAPLPPSGPASGGAAHEMSPFVEPDTLTAEIFVNLKQHEGKYPVRSDYITTVQTDINYAMRSILCDWYVFFFLYIFTFSVYFIFIFTCMH